MIPEAIRKMISFYEGNLHDIEHFLKVWAYAKTIGELEQLDAYTQETLELTAVVHDISCPLCRKKYGSAEGAYQEAESIPLVREFLAEFNLPEEQLDRICYIVSHHHTTSNVDGLDYQFLLEADFLVNASEGKMRTQVILDVYNSVFKSNSGKKLLADVYKIGK